MSNVLFKFGDSFNPYFEGSLLWGENKSASGSIITRNGDFEFHFMNWSEGGCYIKRGTIITYCNKYGEMSALAWHNMKLSTDEIDALDEAKCWAALAKHIPVGTMLEFIKEIGDVAYGVGKRDGSLEIKRKLDELLRC